MRSILAVCLTVVTLILPAFAANNLSIPEYPCFTQSSLDALVPQCAKGCQQIAMRNDGCENYEDVACHCAMASVIGAIIAPCLAFNSSCGLSDTVTLWYIIDPVCSYFNATINGTLPKPQCGAPQNCPSTKPSSPNHTTTVSIPTTNATAIPFTGLASSIGPQSLSLVLALLGFLAFAC